MAERMLTNKHLPAIDVSVLTVPTPRFAGQATSGRGRLLLIELVDGSHYDMSQDYFRFMFEPGVEPTKIGGSPGISWDDAWSGIKIKSKIKIKNGK